MHNRTMKRSLQFEGARVADHHDDRLGPSGRRRARRWAWSDQGRWPLAAKALVIKGTLSGGQSSIIPGSDTVVMGGFKGKLGKAPMQSSIYGEVSGNTFEGGSMHLFNSQGDIIANLGSGTLKKSGKNHVVTLEFNFEHGTDAYSQLVGCAGTVTIELESGKSKAKPAAADLAQSVWDAKTAKSSTTSTATLATFFDSSRNSSSKRQVNRARRDPARRPNCSPSSDNRRRRTLAGHLLAERQSRPPPPDRATGAS